MVTREALAELLKDGKQIRVKHGIDCTAPELHIGHAAHLWKLRAFQEAGHKAVLILGDATTAIGDPTGRSKTRPALAKEVIRKNAAAIQKQAEKILLTNRAVYEVHKNSEWYGSMRTQEFLNLLSLVTHARLIERDMFQKRMQTRSEIYVHELLYPILQGYDSVMIRSDLTVIGSDQFFNEHMGRFMQEKFGQAPQIIVSLTILPGLDGGEKMSKSLGNRISLLDAPRDKFGKAMRTRDALIIPYLTAYTDVPTKEILAVEKEITAGGNPMDAKLFFAESLVGRYHGPIEAKRQRQAFMSVFSKKELDMIPATALPYGDYTAIDLLTRLKLASSKSEARRLVLQRAVEVDQKTIENASAPVIIRQGTTVRVGKKRLFRIQ